MASDRYGAIGVEMKHVVTFVLNSSKALDFKSTEKKSTIEIELTLNSCIENVFLLIVFHLTIIDDSPAMTVACTLALPQLKRISPNGIKHRQKTALLICVTIHFWIQLCD